MKTGRALLVAGVAVLIAMGRPPVSVAAPVISDGSDGPFGPLGGIVTLNLPSNGVFNFTTINIPAGVLVKFNRNVANTPVYFAATGDVVIDGVLDVSATATDVLLPPVPENPKQGGGPGGYDGGRGGDGSDPSGGPGGGPGGGARGYPGGGAGNATEGKMAHRYGGAPGNGGPSVPYPDPLSGGSGAGGGDSIFHYIWYDAGFGGGGGGAVQVSTPGNLSIGGSILANGANGGWGFANIFGNGGPGGGGSGGCVELYAGSVVLDPDGLLQANGGYGGGLSTQPYSWDPPAYSSGADGGLGYVRIEGGMLDLRGTIEGVPIIVPLPPTIWLLAFAGLALIRRRRRT